MGSKYLVFRNYSSLFLNGYSIYGLCITFWTNEFLGSYSNYKFIISFSMFSRMGLWGIWGIQSNIEEVLSLSFSTPIFPFHSSKRFVWSYSSSLSIFSSNSFWDLFTLFFFGEIRNLTTFTRLMDCNNGFSISFFFLSFLSSLWIGAQFPQEKFLSYARILTLDFYFLLFFFFFKKKKKKKKKKK